MMDVECSLQTSYGHPPPPPAGRERPSPAACGAPAGSVIPAGAHGTLTRKLGLAARTAGVHAGVSTARGRRSSICCSDWGRAPRTCRRGTVQIPRESSIRGFVRKRLGISPAEFPTNDSLPNTGNPEARARPEQRIPKHSRRPGESPRM